jgi:LEA14-like dessication related protein
MQSPLPSFFLSFLVLCLFLSCGSVIEPDFKGIENVKLSQAGLNESSLTLDLYYFNPNKYRLTLKEAEGDAWMEGIPLGHFTIDTLIRIPANADFRLPVKLKMDMNYFLQNTAAALFNNEVAIKIEGRARVGKSGIFIHYPIHYEGKQNLRNLLK